jgi:predicted N-acetyltransferase YhbS
MNLSFKTDIIPTARQVIELYKSAGLVRPVDDVERIAKMYEQSNLIITAWEGEVLIGVSRALTDFCYCCYLSDLAVRKEYQSKGIGKALIAKTKELIGEQSMLLLLSAPGAIEYYPKIGMEKVNNGFIIKREK